MDIFQPKVLFEVRKVHSDGSMSMALRYDTEAAANRFVDGRIARNGTAGGHWLVSKIELIRDTRQ